MEEREGPRLKKRDPKSHLNDGIRAENESELKEQERRAVDQNLESGMGGVQLLAQVLTSCMTFDRCLNLLES